MRSSKPIPYFVDPPELTPEIIDQITLVVFGEIVEPEPSDLIFVFGGSYPGLWETAATAFNDGLAPHVLATGGYMKGARRHNSWNYGDVPEAEVIADNLIRLGVPRDCITCEVQSTNTYENVLSALCVYDFMSVSKILSVSKSYAVGRQTRTLRANLENTVKVIPLPFNARLAGSGPIVTRHNWIDIDESRAYVFANLLKIHSYSEIGHVEPIEGISEELEALITTALADLH